MPLYEYKCEKCDQVFEVRQKFSDAPIEVHEDCGGHVERLLSAPAFQLKGTGWYITDYARSGSGGGKSEKSGGSSGESKSESKSESKAESKSESSSGSSSSSSSETKSSSTPAKS